MDKSRVLNGNFKIILTNLSTIKRNYEEDEELNYNPDEMMGIMFDEDCDPDENKSARQF